MLAKVAASLPGTVAPLGAAWYASGRLTRVLSRAYASSRGEESGESSYQRMKDVASKSGNPAKEWMEGVKEQASSATRSATESAEQMYEATKRGAQDATTHAKEAIGGRGLKNVKQMVGGAEQASESRMEGMVAAGKQTADAARDKVSAGARMVSDAVDSAVGDANNLPSARAQFEASRSAEVKAEEGQDRKSQLTDEASTGDNPREQRTRDEHEILDTEFYTKH